jgi:hypothetical protein
VFTLVRRNLIVPSINGTTDRQLSRPINVFNDRIGRSRTPVAHDFNWQSFPTKQAQPKVWIQAGLELPSLRINMAVEGTENQAVNRASFMNAPGLIDCL